jgi:hypothetical protein
MAIRPILRLQSGFAHFTKLPPAIIAVAKEMSDGGAPPKGEFLTRLFAPGDQCALSIGLNLGVKI